MIVTLITVRLHFAALWGMQAGEDDAQKALALFPRPDVWFGSEYQGILARYDGSGNSKVLFPF